MFSFIKQYGSAEAQSNPLPPVPFGSIANPIAVMENEHVSAGDALADIRALTHDYQLPPYACTTVRALYAGVQALEADLHVHIHLENNILFPRAIALENRRLATEALVGFLATMVFPIGQRVLPAFCGMRLL